MQTMTVAEDVEGSLIALVKCQVSQPAYNIGLFCFFSSTWSIIYTTTTICVSMSALQSRDSDRYCDIDSAHYNHRASRVVCR